MAVHAREYTETDGSNNVQGAPIAGFMLNAYGGEKAGFQAYRPAIFYAGSMALAAAGLTGFVRLRINANLTGKL